MITTLLVNGKLQNLNRLQKTISQFCPQIHVCGIATNLANAFQIINEKHPSLIFIDKGSCKLTCVNVLQRLCSLNIETILISDEKEFAYSAINFQIGTYLLKPLKEEALKEAVQKASTQIKLKQEKSYKKESVEKIVYQKLPYSELIGIPTMEGYEFIKIEEIIRCEGLQKCTRVITTDRTGIISSYNIGEFRKKLKHYGFYSPHKSHLINLRKVKKYHKEGTIILADNSSVPVARRKKMDFLSQVYHL